MTINYTEPQSGAVQEELLTGIESDGRVAKRDRGGLGLHTAISYDPGSAPLSRAGRDRDDTRGSHSNSAAVRSWSGSINCIESTVMRDPIGRHGAKPADDGQYKRVFFR